MNRLELIHQHNKLIVKIMWISVILSIGLCIVTHKPMTTTLSIVTIGLVSTIIMTIFTFKKIFIVQTMYIVVLSLAALSFMMMYGVQHITAYIMIYYSLILVSIYQEITPIIISGSIGTAYTIYFYFAFQEKMFPTCNMSSFYNFIFYIVMFTFILVLNSRFSNTLKAKAIESLNEATDAKEKTERVLKKLRGSIEMLNDFSLKLKENIDTTGKISGDITNTFSQIAAGVERQTKDIEIIDFSVNSTNDEIKSASEASEIMNRLSYTIENIVDNSSQLVMNLSSQIQSANKTMNTTVEIISELTRQTEQIGNIISSINGISDQTNLLALNASIEAARAGEHGRGFAVVADEVRKLAESSMESTEKVSDILVQIKDKAQSAAEQILSVKDAVDFSSTAVGKVETAFKDVSSNTKEVVSKANSVNEMISKVKKLSNDITQNLNGISAETQETNAAIEEVLSSIEEQNSRINNIVESYIKIEDMAEDLKKQ